MAMYVYITDKTNLEECSFYQEMKLQNMKKVTGVSSYR